MFLFNATFFVQIIHFIIAYCIVRFLIIRPLVVVVMQENAVALTLKETIQERNLAIENKQKEIELHWHESQDAFAARTPTLHSPVSILEGKAHMHRVPFDVRQEEELIKEFSHVIISQVKHVQ